MPKKPTKTKEEKTAESFFRVDEDDLRSAIEKEIKKDVPKQDWIKKAIEKTYSRPDRNQLETIEKISKKGTRKKATRKKTSKKKYSKKSETKKEYLPPKITLKKDGYELVITEKPQAALKIASALGKSTKKNLKGVPYYEVNRDGQQIVVGCAVGHLFTLKQNPTGSSVPIFDISWTPNFLARKKDFTKKYYEALLSLAKKAGSITVATDFDIEGEVIGLNVVRFICNQKDASRMKFSTLTDKELNESYENKFPTINWGQAIAGETRHYLDWFYGINLSRALMNAIKTTGRFKIMSIGRVQGPSLNLIVKKEREIQKFKSTPYWQVFIQAKEKTSKKEIELKHNKDITNKKDLDKFEKLKGEKIELETSKREQVIQPNPPFNLTTLQTEAYKLHGKTPAQTLKIAQSLYLNGAISYPRTSSQKLPEAIGYKEILQKLAKEYNVEHLIKNSKPIEGKKSDPAHPSIYPTGQKAVMNSDEEKIYNLIVKRFLCLFCESAIIDNKTVKTKVKGLIFSARGSAIRKKAWMEIYPSQLKENEIPDMEGEGEIKKVRTEEKETQPPKRYSPASILSELEKRNLGTKATRAAILETLYDRGYVRDKSIQATPLGMSLISTLEKYSPIIIDEELTRHFEKGMESILEAKKDLLKKEEKIVEEAKGTITKISKQFNEHETKIGKELLNANDELIQQQKIENTLCQCPVCKKGNLAITYSRKTKRYFVACDAYPNCKTTFSLPPNGIFKKANKTCEECGFPKVIRLSKGRRPWEFCFNRECPTNAEWAKKDIPKKKETSEEK